MLMSFLEEVYDDNDRTDEIHASNKVCDDRHIWTGVTRATVPQTNSTPQSVSTGGELADASPEHEWRSVGRINPRGYRSQRQHLGLSSMFQYRARRCRYLRRPLSAADL